MRYSQLRAFHNVAVFNSFSRAAEAMHLTQPAVSEQVRKLEQHHDILLFHRTKKRVGLTPLGEQLFQITKMYFEVEDQIADFLSETSGAIDGELRIVADSAHHVTDVLRRFQRLYPGVTVSLKVGNTEQILAQLRSYDAEIGVVGIQKPGTEFDVLGISTSEIVAFCGPEILPDRDSVRIAELVDYPLIYREQGSKTRQKLEQAAAALKVGLNPAIVAEGREAVREVVASGAGIGFVSIAEFGNDSRLRPLRLEDARVEMSESLVCLKQRRDIKLIRAFMSVAKDPGDQANTGP